MKLNWTKKASRGRMKRNQALQNVYKHYPLARLVVESAAKIGRTSSYNRISCHYAYKEWMWAAIGGENEAFWICIDVIDDVLPPDATDLDQGSSITTKNPALPGLPPLPAKGAETTLDVGKLQFLSLSELEREKEEAPDPRRQTMRTMLETLAAKKEAKQD
jgi:hypothetical protein